MKNINFKSIYDLEEFLRDKKEIGAGAEGKCYKIDDYVLKIYTHLLEEYDEPLIRYGKDEYIKHFLQFKDVKVNNFNFIENVVFIDGDYFVGTISKYVEGKTLQYDTLYNIPIDEIITGIAKLIPSIRDLSKNYNISVDDVFINNIIYNEGNFNFIDTASYYYNYEEPYYVYKNNLIEIIKELMLSITNSYHRNSIINEFLIKTNFEYNYNFDGEILCNPIKLLKEFKKSLEEYCDKEIVCFKDCEKILRKKLT